MPHTPITAIVIFRNEADRLEPCLRALGWCDELIGIDMRSADASRRIARQYVDRLFEVPPYPIAEPTRVAAARLAKHDWILLVDPDEIIDEKLPVRIQALLAEQPDLGAVRLPWLFHFKGERLRGTVWGGTHHNKRMLIHRDRCALLPYCNRITELKQGQRDATIACEPGAIVRHYWSDSYRNLLHRHLFRYAALDAARMFDEGKRFSLWRGFVHPAKELHRSLRHFDGWRIGLRGWVLSAIYGLYVATCEWQLLRYRFAPPARSHREQQIIPSLRELSEPATTAPSDQIKRADASPDALDTGDSRLGLPAHTPAQRKHAA